METASGLGGSERRHVYTDYIVGHTEEGAHILGILTACQGRERNKEGEVSEDMKTYPPRSHSTETR